MLRLPGRFGECSPRPSLRRVGLGARSREPQVRSAAKRRLLPTVHLHSVQASLGTDRDRLVLCVAVHVLQPWGK